MQKYDDATIRGLVLSGKTDEIRAMALKEIANRMYCHGWEDALRDMLRLPVKHNREKRAMREIKS